MLQMNQNYEPEFKIVRLHLEEGRSLKGLDSPFADGTIKELVSNRKQKIKALIYIREKG